jgi:hypothetical protein
MPWVGKEQQAMRANERSKGNGKRLLRKEQLVKDRVTKLDQEETKERIGFGARTEDRTLPR